MNHETFFVSEAVRHARNLSYLDCIRFLQGLLLSCGDISTVSVIREAVMQIRAADKQLEELILPSSQDSEEPK